MVNLPYSINWLFLHNPSPFHSQMQYENSKENPKGLHWPYVHGYKYTGRYMELSSEIREKLQGNYGKDYYEDNLVTLLSLKVLNLISLPQLFLAWRNQITQNDGWQAFLNPICKCFGIQRWREVRIYLGIRISEQYCRPQEMFTCCARTIHQCGVAIQRQPIR